MIMRLEEKRTSWTENWQAVGEAGQSSPEQKILHQEGLNKTGKKTFFVRMTDRLKC